MKVRIKREDWCFYLDPWWHQWQEAEPWNCLWSDGEALEMNHPTQGKVLVLRKQVEIKEND